MDNKGANIYASNILLRLFYQEGVFSQWKANIECLLFLSPLTNMYASNEMSRKQYELTFNVGFFSLMNNNLRK